jgi:hypothetical protein
MIVSATNDLIRLAQALMYIGGKIAEGKEHYDAYTIVGGMAMQAALSDRPNLTAEEWDELIRDEEIGKAGLTGAMERFGERKS